MARAVRCAAWYGVAFLALACCLGAATQNDLSPGHGVTAHRGNSGDQPENTMPAFQSGIETGCDWLELDVYRTKDGKLAVIHDRTTGRVGGKNLVVADSTDAPRQLMAVKAARQFQPVQCEGFYPKHLQGICTNDRDAIYWCFTDVLVKTDAKGHVLKQVPVANHHGDLCFCAGKLYVAVNLGKFNQPPGKADSWVYVYDAETLKELTRHKTPELVHGAGGIASRDGRFLVVGGLPPGADENYLYEYDESFRFLKRHVLASGYTLMGIQTAAFIHGHWWFGCYGKPAILLKADPSFRLVGRYEFDCSLGIVGLPDGRILVARGLNVPDKKGLTAKLVFAEPDKDTGLVVQPVERVRKN